MFTGADRTFAKFSRRTVVAAALAALWLVGALDFLTGPEISFSVFYLVPVGIAAWYAGRKAGLVFAIVASLVWYGVEIADAHPYHHPFIPMWNAFVRFSFFLIIALLLSVLRERLHTEARLARIDALTELLNPRGFAEQLLHDLALTERLGNPLTLAYIDVDDFKRINDTHGHGEGDSVLRTIGQTLLKGTRQSDSVARLGGDEFALILPATDLVGAETIVSKLKTMLSEAASEGGCSFTCSVGAVEFRERSPSVGEAIAVADRLMYDAKTQGKNAAVFGVYARTAAAGTQHDSGPAIPPARIDG